MRRTTSQLHSRSSVRGSLTVRNREVGEIMTISIVLRHRRSLEQPLRFPPRQLWPLHRSLLGQVQSPAELADPPTLRELSPFPSNLVPIRGSQLNPRWKATRWQNQLPTLVTVPAPSSATIPPPAEQRATARPPPTPASEIIIGQRVMVLLSVRLPTPPTAPRLRVTPWKMHVDSATTRDNIPHPLTDMNRTGQVCTRCPHVIGNPDPAISPTLDMVI